MVDKGEFLLKRYSLKNNIEFSFNGHEIKLTSNSDNAERLTKLTAELALTAETSRLTIDGPADQDRLRDLAVDIKHLLSIAIGRRVTFDRQVYWT